jgi:ketosteroid isomerase-like protein
MADRLQTVRDCYTAYETGDRELVEGLLSPDYTFFSPPDPGIDRDRYFERCWPNSQAIDVFEYVRLAGVGDEVLVTYEATRADGSKFRNTEIFGFAGELIARTEVYFGWNITA